MFGQLQISSNPDGARVTIDGTPRGVTPLIAAVSPGSHTVQILRNGVDLDAEDSRGRRHDG